ncbi:hypothetical protein Tsubulata_044085, partial [Turnera subulata]
TLTLTLTLTLFNSATKHLLLPLSSLLRRQPPPSSSRLRLEFSDLFYASTTSVIFLCFTCITLRKTLPTTLPSYPCKLFPQPFLQNLQILVNSSRSP